MLGNLRGAWWPVAAATLALLLIAASSVAASPPASRRYHLSAQLLGPRDAQRKAVARLARDLERGPPEAGLAPPGDYVGTVDTAQEALDWVAAHAFDYGVGFPEPPGILSRLPAPMPGGPVAREHEVLLDALIVSGVDTDGLPRPIRWPSDQSSLLPSEAQWVPAALVPRRAPIFAAPGPVVPPMSERFGVVTREGGLFVLGQLDRCTDAPPDRATCLRWAQVIVRDSDRFRPGYLPAFQVATMDGWIPDTHVKPRAHLIASGIHRGEAQFLLLARAEGGSLHRITITAPRLESGFPPATLSVEGDVATVRIEGRAPLHLTIGPGLDARPEP